MPDAPETFPQACRRLLFEARDRCVKSGGRITGEIIERIIEEQVKVFGLSPVRAGLVNAEVYKIYSIYPVHKAPKRAYKAIEKALREVNPKELLTKTCQFAHWVSRWPSGYRYTKEGRDIVPHPATWFNAGGYMEDQEEWAKPVRKETLSVNYSKF